MNQTLQSFIVNTSSSNNRYFAAACIEMEALLNQFIQIENYSNLVNQLIFTFSFPDSKSHRIKEFKALQKEDHHTILQISLTIDHPYFLHLDKENAQQYMIERFLEAIFIGVSLDHSLQDIHLYNDVKRIFYRSGWFTRVIFPAA